MRATRSAVLVILALASCRPAPHPRTASVRPPAADPAHVQAVDAWHRDRIRRLRGEASWLALAGLYWLREGQNSIGSAADNYLVWPARAPAHVGVVTLWDDQVLLDLAPGIKATCRGRSVRRMQLHPDGDPRRPPDRVALDGFTMLIISRGGRLALRLYDREAPTRLGFRGIERFPVDSRWRFQARFVAYPHPHKVLVPTIIETTDETIVSGELVFTAGGKQHRLLPFSYPGARTLFLHFTDATTGRQTYGGGRFLDAPLPAAGVTELDFNRAYNPPCAFTDYATCPIPLPQNRLALAVTAGEKRYAIDTPAR